jgi:hypothetical protein
MTAGHHILRSRLYCAWRNCFGFCFGPFFFSQSTRRMSTQTFARLDAIMPCFSSGLCAHHTLTGSNFLSESVLLDVLPAFPLVYIDSRGVWFMNVPFQREKCFVTSISSLLSGASAGSHVSMAPMFTVTLTLAFSLLFLRRMGYRSVPPRPPELNESMISSRTPSRSDALCLGFVTSTDRGRISPICHESNV